MSAYNALVPSVTTLELGLVPVSFNRTRYAKWYVARRHNEDLKQAIGVALMVARVTKGWASVEASAVLTFATNRLRDEGNFRTPLEKALGDVLTSGGWLDDDTPDQYRFTTLDFSADTGKQKTVLKLTWQPKPDGGN